MASNDQKVDSNRYQLIPRVLIFATREEKLLLLKGSPQKKLWANLYNGIGGHVEPGESIITAAKREFREETGLDLFRTKLSVVITIDTGQSPGIALFVLIGNAGSGNPTPSKEGSLEWVNPNNINLLPTVDDLKVLIPKILNQHAEHITIFAQYKYDQSGNLHIEFYEDD